MGKKSRRISLFSLTFRSFTSDSFCPAGYREEQLPSTEEPDHLLEWEHSFFCRVTAAVCNSATKHYSTMPPVSRTHCKNA